MASDFHELDDLEHDLRGAGVRAALGAPAVVSKGAHNVMTEARGLVAGYGHLRQYPRSITYDLEITSSSVAAEIGPDKQLPQGALGNLIEYGSINNAPIEHLHISLEHEEPGFYAAAEDLAHRSVLG